MKGDEALVDIQSAADAISIEESSSSPLHEIESLCMRCGQDGITKILLTRIPHFKELVLMAFECPHCYERNNEVQFAGQLQPHGCYCHLEVSSADQQTLNRQVVKSDSATIKIPELDFEIPPEAQRGTLSTVEGILKRAADELEALQPERMKVDPGTSKAIDNFLINLRSFAEGNASFSFILDDPAGNSFIENPMMELEEGSGTEETDSKLLEDFDDYEHEECRSLICEGNSFSKGKCMTRNRRACIVYRRGQKQLTRLFLQEAEHALELCASEQ